MAAALSADEAEHRADRQMRDRPALEEDVVVYGACLRVAETRWRAARARREEIERNLLELLDEYWAARDQEDHVAAVLVEATRHYTRASAVLVLHGGIEW